MVTAYYTCMLNYSNMHGVKDVHGMYRKGVMFVSVISKGTLYTSGTMPKKVTSENIMFG